jgi:23S rRNA (cytosine1962-C5)-methyltransferase
MVPEMKTPPVDDTSQAGGPLSAKHHEQADMLANKVRKRYRHLAKRFARRKIEVFRLYDWDIPEIRAVVDWYAGHLVVGEYTRTQTIDAWLPLMAQAVARALEVPPERVHLKKRYYGASDGKRYQRIDHTDQMIEVSETDLRFLVNPYDWVDTGLFADHRITRGMVRELARGKDFLNLFCYTASFTCYAARGGARSTVSVDRSRTVVAWAKRNLALNDIAGAEHLVVQAHALDFIAAARRRNQLFDLAVVDPPSFSSRRSSSDHFDIAQDHPLLLNAVVEIMRPGGTIFFSTNHQYFQPRLDEVRLAGFEEITSRTIPEDYQHKRKTIHRCWKLAV